MKVIFATVISCGLAAVSFTANAQSPRAGGSAAAAGSAGSIAAGGSTTLRPTGNLAAGAQVPGTALSTPAGATPGVPQTPANVTIVGPLNPGGISGIPPQSVGRTFDRSIIGGAPIDTGVDLANPQPTFRFPPASTVPQPLLTPNGLSESQGIPNSAAFPTGPVSVGNTVGTNFNRILTNVAPREPVAINLPPGAVIVTNIAGVPEVVVPAPGIVPAPRLVPTNAVGRGPTFESSTARSLPPSQRVSPPISRFD